MCNCLSLNNTVSLLNVKGEIITEANSQDDIKFVQGNRVITLRGNVIPIVMLEEVLDVKKDNTGVQSYTVVIVSKGDKTIGLVVDSLIGQQEIVIKSLGKLINVDNVISGATVLGDGEVALILDVNTLV